MAGRISSHATRDLVKLFVDTLRRFELVEGGTGVLITFGLAQAPHINIKCRMVVVQQATEGVYS